MADTASETPLPIVFCPVCCTPDDATDWGKCPMQCGACGTHYVITLVPAIVAAHSMTG